MHTPLPFFTLLLLISFASVNAVLFTPALPAISHYFHIADSATQQTITWFLLGYTVGQLLYGPIANRFGRKPALYMGISLQILSSLLCALAPNIEILVLGRFLLALGAGVGLKMTFTLVNETHEPKEASQKISYLMLAFAITPGLSVAAGGILTMHYGWQSCFYAGALYGVILLMLVAKLPETHKNLHPHALNVIHLSKAYTTQLKNTQLITGSLLMGSATCFVYTFAAIAPFVANKLFGMSDAEYGMANILPSIGLIVGSLAGAQLVKKYSLHKLMRIGIAIASIGALLMTVAMWYHLSIWLALFIPMMVIYFGLCFIMANASTLALNQVTDKSHGSAMMNFINMGCATVVVFSISYLPVTVFLLPILYLFLCGGMGIIFSQVTHEQYAS